MRFYFPDSQDLVSPTYDFIHDEYSPLRVRQRDDLYAHEVLDRAPYDGILVSKAIVDGSLKGAGKYSEPQRQRLYRLGVARFFRLPDGAQTLGDCGAFNYVNEPEPPYTIDEVVDFYGGCGFQAGISIDHIILGYDRDAHEEDVDPAWRARQEISLRLAGQFRERVAALGDPFEPVGAAQGWSPSSYANSVAQLQELGYHRIAMGGMVALKTPDILQVLQACDAVRRPSTELHLLGVTRVDSMAEFRAYGVTSFDSTTPLRQSFMDDRNNYHTSTTAYSAIRVPQVDGNPALKRAILSGDVAQKDAVRLERESLRRLRGFDAGTERADRTLEVLAEYEALVSGPTRKSYIAAYARTLHDAPWRDCDCRLCRDLGIEILIFRGTERNKRRGFHNLHVLGTQVRHMRMEESSGGRQRVTSPRAVDIRDMSTDATKGTRRG